MMEETGSKKKVLVVDDEPGIRSTLRKSLTKEYLVLEASNGEVAIDMARQEKPDIILMDIMMPKVDGYTACYSIKEDPTTKAIPVVMLTALGFELNKKLGQQMGVDGYITKPFDYHSLLDTIKHFLRDRASSEAD